MISHTQTSANQYGFYAVPKKLQPKKKYRQSDYQYEQEEISETHEKQLEEIEDVPKIQQKQVERDFYVDEAPYPEFKPKEAGLDYGVQVQRGDLFDFNLEVQPLLQILVGRSVVSAINELQQEKEKREKKQKLENYQKLRNAQLMVTQRLEAKSKRKKEESQRRTLQKDIYVKNKKEAAKKVLARKNAKKALLGLKNELLGELQQAGFLRSEPESDLRINYQGWLYEQITIMDRTETQVEKEAKRIVEQAQKQNEQAHKRNIEKQQRRRREIQEERSRIKKQNAQKKERKRLRKQKMELNTQREPNAIKFEELLDKSEPVNNILSFETLSDGFTESPNNAVHISGGLFNFLLVLLHSSSKTLSGDQVRRQLFQVQNIVEILLQQLNTTLQVELSEEHYRALADQLKYMEENGNQFMKNKSEKVKVLKQKIAIHLVFLEANKIHIKREIHDNILEAILNLLMTTTNTVREGQKQEQVYSPNEEDKKRAQLAKKIKLKIASNQNISQRKINQILRTRFERKYPENSSKSQQQKQQKSQQQFIDIYDGLGWDKHCQEYPQECNREAQKPAAYPASLFSNNFVYDERTLYYLRRDLEKLLKLQSGAAMDRYIEQLCNFREKLEKKEDIPVYDAELRYQ